MAEVTDRRRASSRRDFLRASTLGFGSLAMIQPARLMASGVRGSSPQVREIGSRLEPFVDDWLIETMKGVELKLHRPVPREVVLEFDRPWEGSLSYAPVYMNSCSLYYRAPHLYLMFPKRFFPKRKVREDWTASGISESVFMASRDGIHWDRRFMEAFLRPGSDPDNWTDRNMYKGVGVVPTGPAEMSIYYMEHYRHPSVRLRRGSLRIDGFVSVNGLYSGGELLTRPLTFEGRELVLNYATSAAGSLRVEVQDAEGKPMDGFGLADCVEIIGDEIERIVAWRAGSDLGSLSGKPVRLRFAVKDADLYSIRFRM